jgi:hypothetical protein
MKKGCAILSPDCLFHLQYLLSGYNTKSHGISNAVATDPEKRKPVYTSNLSYYENK